MLSGKQNSMRRHQRNNHHYHNIRRLRLPFPGINKVKTSAAIVVSINKSVVKCRHNLVKLLSQLARIATPSCSLKGFEILRRQQEKIITPQLEGNNNVVVASLQKNREILTDFPDGILQHDEIFEANKFVPRPSFLFLHNNNNNNKMFLPPLVSDKKGTIVLDLDETLVHSCLDPPPPRYDFTVTRNMNRVTINFYVLKRPGMDEFLEMISKKYEVVVFTAGHKDYASKVLDILDPKGLFISHRFYRDSCKRVRGIKFVKDLSKIGRDLKKVVIVDDNPKSFALQPENGIPIKPFLGDELWDRELMKLAGFFERCDVFQDMRDAVNQYVRRC